MFITVYFVSDYLSLHAYSPINGNNLQCEVLGTVCVCARCHTDMLHIYVLADCVGEADFSNLLQRLGFR